MRLRLQGEPHHDLSFQSTHPHGVRPSYIEAQTVHSSVVSIHAPTRGATTNAVRNLLREGVSIHAPTRGATNLLAGTCIINLRPVSIHAPTRGATRPQYAISPYTIVSIHAPTRGATRCFCWIYLICLNGFNPRTHTGCDLSFFFFRQ